MRLNDMESLALKMIGDQGGDIFLVIDHKDLHDCASSRVISITWLG